jgi:hypothetical protein
MILCGYKRMVVLIVVRNRVKVPRFARINSIEGGPAENE